MPQGTSTKYTYDADNNRIAFTDPNEKKTAYAYDKLNRLSKVTDALISARYTPMTQ